MSGIDMVVEVRSGRVVVEVRVTIAGGRLSRGVIVGVRDKKGEAVTAPMDSEAVAAICSTAIARVESEMALAWTGPRSHLLPPTGMLPPEHWPYGPPHVHQEVCMLFAGATECDCAASDAEDTEWGLGA